jgi:hypothetical protein
MSNTASNGGIWDLVVPTLGIFTAVFGIVRNRKAMK